MQFPVPAWAAAFSHPDDVGPPKSILMYGKTGTRKTTMYAELVAYGALKRGLIIDIDNGTETLANDPVIRQAIQDGRLSILPINSLDQNAFIQMETVLLDVLGMTREPNPIYAQGNLIPDPRKPDLGFDLVVFDTLNIAQTIAVDYYLKTTFTEKGKRDTLAAWGLVGTWTMGFARALQNTNRFVGGLPMHPMSDSENTGKVTIKPKLQGGAKDSIATVPSMAIYLDFERTGNGDEVVLVGYVGESDKYETKNRYRLPPKIMNFNLLRLWQAIEHSRSTGQPIASMLELPITQTPTAAPYAAPAA